MRTFIMLAQIGGAAWRTVCRE